jgi:predicted nucleic acid-binding protein
VSVLLDTGIVYAYYDRSDDWHARAKALVQHEARGLIVPAPVIPEVDYLLGRRLGAASRRAFYRGITEGHYMVADLPRQAYPRLAAIDEQFAELDLGFVDAAIVALAEAMKVPRIATADRRHFEPLARRLSLELLPA